MNRGYYHPGRDPRPRRGVEMPAQRQDPDRPLTRQERRKLERQAAKGDVKAARRLGIVK